MPHVSPAKAEANRANAKLSTGPRTAEGKAVVSLNATKHGLSTNRISRRNPEALARFEQRRAAYRAQYGGEDPALAGLIDALTIARTRLDRIEAAQDHVADITSAEYQLLQRYWREAGSCFARTLGAIEAIRARSASRPGIADLRQKLEAKRREYQALIAELFPVHNPPLAAELALFRQRLHRKRAAVSFRS